MFKTTIIMLAVLCLAVFGCGNGDEGDKKGGETPPAGGGNTGGGNTGGGGGGGVPERPTPPAMGGGVAGTYVLDTSNIIEFMEKQALSEIPDASDMGDMGDMGGMDRDALIKMAKDQVAEMVKGMSMEATLSPDGTFKVAGGFMGDPMDVSGTYAVDGEKITFTTLVEDGAEKDEPQVASGTVKDGVIHFKPEEDMPFELVLRKK